LGYSGYLDHHTLLKSIILSRVLQNIQVAIISELRPGQNFHVNQLIFMILETELIRH